MNEQLPIPLSHGGVVALPERADRIRSLVAVARGCIIEVGRELIAAKADLAHGEWLPWLDREFGWSDSTAANYMAVARKFPSVGNLDGLTIDATALYALSAPDVSQEARDEAMARAEDGERITKAEAERIIADAMQDERAKFAQYVRELQAEHVQRIVAAEKEAAERFADDTAVLENELGRLRDNALKPDVATLVEQLCKATGRQKLKPEQYQHLAYILGVGVTDGKRVYPPATQEESIAAEEQLRISGPALRALEYFQAAPAPAEVRAALRPAQVDNVRRITEHAVDWMREFAGNLKGE